MDETSYEMRGDIAIFRTPGSHGLEDGAQLVKSVILRARQAGIRKLLVDATAFDADPPTVSQRHWVMTEWAGAGRGAMRVALAIRSEFIDPQNFGTAVARNHGLDFRAFTDAARALAWLQDGHAV